MLFNFIPAVFFFHQFMFDHVNNFVLVSIMQFLQVILIENIGMVFKYDATRKAQNIFEAFREACSQYCWNLLRLDFAGFKGGIIDLPRKRFAFVAVNSTMLQLWVQKFIQTFMLELFVLRCWVGEPRMLKQTLMRANWLLLWQNYLLLELEENPEVNNGVVLLLGKFELSDKHQVIVRSETLLHI